MKPIILILLLFLTSLSLPIWAQEKQVVVPYTLADRDRTIRIEAKLDGLSTKIDAMGTKMDVKFIALEVKMDQHFDNLITRLDHLIWMLGGIVALLLFMICYMIWVRKTIIQPALDKLIQTDQLSPSLIKYLREYSKSHPDLAEILKSHGIL